MAKQVFNQNNVLKGCLQNERQAQEKLYRHFFGTMIQMCKRHINDNHQALEVLNNGMLRVFKKIDLYEEKGSLEGWIRRIVYRAICDHHNAQSRYVKYLIFEDYDAPIVAEAEEQTELQDLLNLIDALPEATAKVFKLYAIDGYKHKEISDLLGISSGTSKWHLAEARARLRTMIDQNEKMSRYGAGRI